MMTINSALARIAILGVMLAALSVCALAQTEEAPGFEERAALAAKPVERLLDFSIFGATRGQTARLNVMFTVAPEFSAQMTGARIQVELIFLDGKGVLRKRSVETLLLRQGASLELDIDSLVGPDNRFDIQPCIRTFVGADIHVPLQVIGSVELIENATGRTVLVMEPNDHGVVKPSSGRLTRVPALCDSNRL